MAIDLSKFERLNVADTCSVWNILSSSVLFHAATEMKCNFSVTAFVNYECLYKPRTSQSNEERKLKSKLIEKQKRNHFQVYHLTIEDLQEIEILEKRKALGKGELSSIAFAKRTNQAFLTDDQKARKLAAEIIGPGRVQTTPHLFGWLFFSQRLSDSDKEKIIKEHELLNRPLKPFFERVYCDALQYRLVAYSNANKN